MSIKGLGNLKLIRKYLNHQNQKYKEVDGH
jgi:hypothetical protein